MKTPVIILIGLVLMLNVAQAATIQPGAIIQVGNVNVTFSKPTDIDTVEIKTNEMDFNIDGRWYNWTVLSKENASITINTINVDGDYQLDFDVRSQITGNSMVIGLSGFAPDLNIVLINAGAVSNIQSDSVGYVYVNIANDGNIKLGASRSNDIVSNSGMLGTFSTVTSILMGIELIFVCSLLLLAVRGKLPIGQLTTQIIGLIILIAISITACIAIGYIIGIRI